MPLKINGSTSGSVTLAAPATGSDVTLTLPTLGFGKVLQVVYGSTSTSKTIATTAMTDTNVSATITPSSTSSKILVLMSIQLTIQRFANSFLMSSGQLVRDSTTILSMGRFLAGRFGVSSASDWLISSQVPVVYLDSPNTTSATTYKFQANINDTASSSSAVFQDSGISTVTLIEVGP